jgi:hypothetical protein
MEVRDAVEGDAEELADIADTPADVMRNLVHDRTVRIAECVPDEAAEADGSEREESQEDLRGFVSFDARERTVHVTQLAGTAEACNRLLEEPIRFASAEGMDVELLVERGDETVQSAVEHAGFTERGSGPSFDGTPTTRYRLDTDEAR